MMSSLLFFRRIKSMLRTAGQMTSTVTRLNAVTIVAWKKEVLNSKRKQFKFACWLHQKQLNKSQRFVGFFQEASTRHGIQNCPVEKAVSAFNVAAYLTAKSIRICYECGALFEVLKRRLRGLGVISFIMKEISSENNKVFVQL